MEKYHHDDAQIDELFAKLFANSRLHDENGEEAFAEQNDHSCKPYLSRKSYLEADPCSRRKLYEFALHFDPGLLQSIREWESTEGKGNGFSRIETRAQLILESTYRNLRGHR